MENFGCQFCSFWRCLQTWIIHLQYYSLNWRYSYTAQSRIRFLFMFLLIRSDIAFGILLYEILEFICCRFLNRFKIFFPKYISLGNLMWFGFTWQCSDLQILMLQLCQQSIREDTSLFNKKVRRHLFYLIVLAWRPNYISFFAYGTQISTDLYRLISHKSHYTISFSRWLHHHKSHYT